MAGGGGGGLEDHDPLSVGSYSQLLLSDEVDDLDSQNCFNFTSSFSSSSDQNTPKMLCFGEDGHYNREECDLFFEEITTKIAQKTAGMTCSDSSSASSTATISTSSTISMTTTNVSSVTKSNKKKNASGAGVVNNSEPVGNSGTANGAPLGKQRNCKRTKSADDSTETTTRHAKVKKEKLGERVIALQQLVSPFGKTDTASVLHEAMGYIRFLQDQVQVLCSPYLQRLPSSAHLLEKGRDEEGRESESGGKDLRSKGLCLVPIQLTVRVAETNGADFWSPGMVNKLSSNQ